MSKPIRPAFIPLAKVIAETGLDYQEIIQLKDDGISLYFKANIDDFAHYGVLTGKELVWVNGYMASFDYGFAKGMTAFKDADFPADNDAAMLFRDALGLKIRADVYDCFNELSYVSADRVLVMPRSKVFTLTDRIAKKVIDFEAGSYFIEYERPADITKHLFLSANDFDRMRQSTIDAAVPTETKNQNRSRQGVNVGGRPRVDDCIVACLFHYIQEDKGLSKNKTLDLVCKKYVNYPGMDETQLRKKITEYKKKYGFPPDDEDKGGKT